MRARYKLYFWLGIWSFALMAAFSTWSLVRLKNSIELRKVTGAVQAQLDDVLESVQATDIALLFYQGSGEREDFEDFLESYLKVQHEFNKLIRLIPPEEEGETPLLGPSTRVALHELASLIRDKGELLFRREARSARPETLPVLHRELEFTDSIRDQISEIDAAISSEVRRRENFLEENFSYVFSAILFLLFATLCTLLVFLRIISREMERRSRLETELRRANEAAITSSSKKSDFLAMISHEIRTPLNGMLGMSELIQSRAEGDLKRFATILQESGKSLLRIVNDVLDFSKVEAGKLEFELQEISFARVLELSVELFTSRAHEKRLALFLAYDPDFLRVSAADGARLAQVLQNLVGNSLKFTERGHVSVRGTARPLEENVVSFRVEVADTGVGIRPEDQARVFEPFHQGTGSRREPGTGLGLSICRLLVEAMQGTIGFQSVPGEGSRFWFEVPLRTLRSGETPHPVPGDRLYVGPVDELTRATLQSFAAARHAVLASLDAGATGLLAWPANAPAVPDFPGTVLLLGAEETRVDGAYRSLSYPLSPARIEALLDVPAASREAPVPKPAAEAAPGKAGLVLLVEDNSTNQILAETQLTAAGYQVHLAANGEEALSASARVSYGVILMDCQMPVMDGLEATRQLRAREVQQGRPRTPVIAMTANAYAEDRDRCFAAGMDDFLAKPFELKQLQQILQKWIGARAPALDWTVLEDLAKKTNAQVVKRLLQSFRESLQLGVRAAREGSDEEARRLAHQLKASGGSVGARRLAEACTALEAEKGDTAARRAEFLGEAEAVLAELAAQTRF